MKYAVKSKRAIESKIGILTKNVIWMINDLMKQLMTHVSFASNHFYNYILLSRFQRRYCLRENVLAITTRIEILRVPNCS